MTHAPIRRQGTGPAVSAGGMTVTYLATSDQTGDALGIYHLTLAPKSPGAGPHFHRRMTEAFYILSGTLSMMIDGEAVEAGPGDFALVRPEVVHAFANRGETPVAFILTFTPALGREGFFEGMAALSDADRMSDDDAMRTLMAAFDQEPVEGVGGWTDPITD